MKKKEIKIRLSAEELYHLDKNVRLSAATSREEYLRTLIHDCIPAKMPNADYFVMADELFALVQQTDRLLAAVIDRGVADSELLTECLQLKTNSLVVYNKVLHALEPQPIPGKEHPLCLI